MRGGRHLTIDGKRLWVIGDRHNGIGFDFESSPLVIYRFFDPPPFNPDGTLAEEYRDCEEGH